MWPKYKTITAHFTRSDGTDFRRKTTLRNRKATFRRTFVTGLIYQRLKILNGADEDFETKKGRVSRPQDFKTSETERI